MFYSWFFCSKSCFYFGYLPWYLQLLIVVSALVGFRVGYLVLLRFHVVCGGWCVHVGDIVGVGLGGEV